MGAEKIKIGVIGVGHLGKLHALQLKEVAEAEFLGIFDIDARRAAEVGRELGIPVFEDFPALLEAAEALSIVTPTTTHFEYARQALSTGRHIFIEKPMTETLEQADELIRLGKEKKLKIQIGHIERFNPAILALEPLEIDPLFIEAHRMANFNPRGTDVAVVLDLMIHDIDLILSFVKSPVAELHASGASIISHSEDIANCRIQFENGCVANVTASRISARKMRKMRFFQPNAYISVDFLEGFSEIYYLDRGDFQFGAANLAFSLGEIQKGEEKRQIRYTRLEKKDINPLRYELQLFCRTILEDQPPRVTAEDGRRALRIAGMILESIDEHTALVKKHWKL